MKKFLFLFVLALFMCGCEEKTDNRPPTFPPPLVETPNSNDDQNEGQLAISREAMEVIAGLIQKPVDQITREDLLAIKHYVIVNEEDNLGSSFKALENLESLFFYREVEDLSFIQDLSNLKHLVIPMNQTDTLEFVTYSHHLRFA